MTERHWEHIPGSPDSISVDSHRFLSSHWTIMNFSLSCPGPCLPLGVRASRKLTYCTAWKQLRRDCGVAASNVRQSLGPLTWRQVATHMPREVVTTCSGRDGARGLRVSKRGDNFQNGSLSNQSLTDQQASLNVHDRFTLNFLYSLMWLYLTWEPSWAEGWGCLSGEDEWCLHLILLCISWAPASDWVPWVALGPLSQSEPAATSAPRPLEHRLSFLPRGHAGKPFLFFYNLSKWAANKNNKILKVLILQQHRNGCFQITTGYAC